MVGWRVWHRDDGAIARQFGQSLMVFELPQALKRDAEVQDSRDKAARENATKIYTAPLQGAPPPMPPRTQFPPADVSAPSPAAAPSPGVTRPPSTFQKSVLERTNPAPAPIPAPRLVQPSPSPVSQAGVTASTGAALGFEFAVLFFMVAFFFRYVIPHFRSPIAASSRPATPQGFIPPPLPASPSSQSLGDLTWDEFELLVGELYRRDGFAVEISNATGSDGGIDLVLRRDSARFIVQCKHWKSVKVTVKDIREFFGVLVSESATRGIFVTTTSFTRDAIQFAVGKPLDLIDGSTLDTLIARHPDLLDVSSWSRAFKSGATVKDPMCPSCSSSMVMRSGRHGTFWGCATYPKCRGKRETRKHICRASDGR